MADNVTHWKQYFNPDYLGAYAFEGNEEKVVTIQKVVKEVVVGENGRKEELPVAHFRENLKPLILNRTNAKTITKLTGTPNPQQWGEVSITLYADRNVRGKSGEVTEGVRIRGKLPAQGAVACADCGETIRPHGSFTAETMISTTKEKYGAPLCWACAIKRKEAASGGKE